MNNKLKIMLPIIALLFLWGCAAHPTISPVPLKRGETYTGITFSVENVFPVFVYRKGLSDISDVGFRVGLPIYGSGVDYSRIVFQRGDIYDVINIGFSWTPNSNLDLTYYTVRTFPKKPGNAFYTGFRGMYIPNGISDRESVRVGMLVGISIEEKWGLELGYFHDFDKGQPIEYLFNLEPKNDPRYPAVTDYGLPSENSRLVGLSLQLSLNTKVFSKRDRSNK
ncbi:MAG: hypothetical protein ISS81_00180 [Candidatus Marinimicrobia bacterium]|nr:hypothetical protein [Candidatus Neomarinimicrobiota bacterium]